MPKSETTEQTLMRLDEWRRAYDALVQGEQQLRVLVEALANQQASPEAVEAQATLVRGMQELHSVVLAKLLHPGQE